MKAEQDTVKMNSSVGIYVNPYWSQFAPIEPFWCSIKIVYYVFLILFGLPANISVIAYYTKHSRMETRKSFSYLQINLMVADLLHIANLPFVAYNSFYGEWRLGQAICNLYAICAAYFGFVGIFTMMMISVERYMVIKYPFKVYDSNMKVSSIIIFLSWLYASVWSLLPLLTPNGYVPEGFMTSCTIDYINRDPATHLILLLMTVFGFAVPVIITVVFYALIFVHVKMHNYKLKMKFNIDTTSTKSRRGTTKSRVNMANTKSTSDNQQSGQTIEITKVGTVATERAIVVRRKVVSASKNHYSIKRKLFWKKNGFDTKRSEWHEEVKTEKSEGIQMSAEMRLMRSSLFIVVGFFVTWSPYAIVTMIAQYSPNREKYLTKNAAVFPALFSKFSVALNPIIYGFTNKSLVKIIKKNITRFCRSFPRV
jgi:hypothetical protein